MFSLVRWAPGSITMSRTTPSIMKILGRVSVGCSQCWMKLYTPSPALDSLKTIHLHEPVCEDAGQRRINDTDQVEPGVTRSSLVWQSSEFLSTVLVRHRHTYIGCTKWREGTLNLENNLLQDNQGPVSMQGGWSSCSRSQSQRSSHPKGRKLPAKSSVDQACDRRWSSGFGR